MALSASLRHRRSLTTTVSSLLRSLSSSTSSFSNPPPFTLSSSTTFRSPQSSAVAVGAFQFRSFRSSSIVLSQARQYKPYQEGDEIGPDTILFEGCDYNHWLITMEFPKDPKPSPEEMVRTYEETCAKGLGISIEEAKKKMYACSTTTYIGFQAVMTEEESEKFQGIPGVVFILPDSYIDPVNKEYGGDKYENGKITHRPPPVQYGRNKGVRYRDQNRNPEQQRFNQRGPNEYQQGNPRFDQQGNMQGDRRNYGPTNNYPAPQNFGPPQNNPPQQNFSPPQNYPPQQNFRPQQNYPPQQNAQQNYPPQQNAGPQQNMPPQQNTGPQQNMPPQQNFRPQQNFPPQQNYRPQQNFPPQQRFNEPGGRDDYQADKNRPVHGIMNQGQPGAYVQGGQNYPGQGGQNYPGQGGQSYPEQVGQDHPGQNFRGQGGPGFSRGE